MQYAAFVACCLIWGSTFLAIRIGNQSLPPEWAATLRLVLAAPLLALVVFIRRDRWPRGEALTAVKPHRALPKGVRLPFVPGMHMAMQMAPRVAQHLVVHPAEARIGRPSGVRDCLSQ